MLVFIPAYDTENPGQCLAACRPIVRLHHEMDIPATFFPRTRLLEGDERPDYQELLGDSAFEMASHTVSHAILRPHPEGGLSAAPWDTIVDEVTHSKKEIEDASARPRIGFRTPVGFEDGLGTDKRLIELISRSGHKYSSSQLWGPKCSMPAPFAQARTYAEQGFPDLWEFPAHGWHENILKGYAGTGRCLLWPPVYPDLVLRQPVKTPEDEFAVHRGFADKAAELGVEYVSLIWHPFSLGRFDPGMRMLRLLFSYVRKIGGSFARFSDLRPVRESGRAPGDEQ